MQIPPLNLKQVEIIKGSSSTLYGGGAIAGLINLVTKQPSDPREIMLLINGTSALGLDLSGYYSEKFEHTGLTFLATHNSQRVYDNNDDSFSDLPQIERYSLNPKVYFYFNEKNTLEAGASYIKEDRTGGYLPAIKGENVPVDVYTEENLSNRFSTTLQYIHKLNNKSSISFKNSLGYFKRGLDLPAYSFKGEQISSFSELAYRKDTDDIEWIAGLNFVTEDFNDLSAFTISRDYSDVISGAFGQAVIDLSETLVLEAGLRTDYSKDYGYFILPRASLLIKWNNNFTSRAGGGLGYKLPSLFTEESEELTFRNILPLDKNQLEAERSYGFNFDINYKTILLEKITFTLNNLFFYTRINDPMMLRSSVELREYFEFYTFPGYLDTRGIETNLRVTYKHLKFFAGYSYTDAASVLSEDLSFPPGDNNSQNLSSAIPLVAPHKLGLILFYEEHDSFRIGLEGYYTGEQKLSNGEKGRSYWINGIMLEKHFGGITVFVNFENFLDTRQSKYGPMYTGSISNPVFTEIYAPTDGRIINGGIKLKL
jgi:outer membrane receptor for ferrienterochelin and colicins